MKKQKPLKWHSGPPPHVGWWCVYFSSFDDDSIWRWWNGAVWSIPACSFTGQTKAAAFALTPSFVSNQGRIQWTHYYPENARVPRVKP